MKRTTLKLIFCLMLVASLGGNIYQGRDFLRLQALELLGDPPPSGPIDSNSIESLRAAMSGVMSRVDSLEKIMDTRDRELSKKISEASERMEFYKTFADEMERKATSVCNDTAANTTTIKLIIDEGVKAKTLPSWMTTAR